MTAWGTMGHIHYNVLVLWTPIDCYCPCIDRYYSILTSELHNKSQLKWIREWVMSNWCTVLIYTVNEYIYSACTFVRHAVNACVLCDELLQRLMMWLMHNYNIIDWHGIMQVEVNRSLWSEGTLAIVWDYMQSWLKQVTDSSLVKRHHYVHYETLRARGIGRLKSPK